MHCEHRYDPTNRHVVLDIFSFHLTLKVSASDMSRYLFSDSPTHTDLKLYLHRGINTVVCDIINENAIMHRFA